MVYMRQPNFTKALAGEQKHSERVVQCGRQPRERLAIGVENRLSIER